MTDEAAPHLLDIIELNHRIRNEYSRVVALASHLSTRSRNEETKDALGKVVDQIRSVAEVHKALQPPLDHGVADLAESVMRLCRALMASPDLRHNGTKILLSLDDAVVLDARRCWRVILIVAELIENARRHAFGSQPGCIYVGLAQTADLILCRVSNDCGVAAPSFKPGLGTRLVDRLAIEIGGCVERRCEQIGATVTLSLPKEVSGGPTERWL